MFRIIPLLFLAFLLLRFVLSLKVGRGWKIAIAIFALAIPPQRLITMALASMTSRELPVGVEIFQGLLLALIVFLTIFILLREVAALGFWAVRRKYPSSWLASTPLALGMCGAALVLSLVGMWQGIRVPDVRTVVVTIDRLPKELDGLTIVQLTDLHITKIFPEKWVRDVVARCNVLDADIVLLTGDIADGRPENRLADVSPLADLRAKLGVFGVPGNHEYFSSHYRDWIDIYSGLGIRMLLNEHCVLASNGYSLALGGVTDAAASRINAPGPDIGAALSGVPEGMTKILMSHRPDNAKESARAGVDLQLSGHTHGGQVVGFHFIVKFANDGYYSGLYSVDNMWLYVSNGTGVWTGFPVRLGKPPEITRLVLRAGGD